MIYLDNGATTFPKPKEMIRKMTRCMSEYCGNPGRSGHFMAMKTGEEIYNTRKELGKLFNIEDYTRIVFTANTTEALNLAIKGILKTGDHVITTSMEHNSVLRPLTEMRKKGIQLTIIKNMKDGSFNLEQLKTSIKENTKLIISTHASNVTGTIMPISEIGEIAAANKILFMVDGAQSAGTLKIDVTAMHIDLLAVPGHKGLLGPLGTGALYVKEGIVIKTLKEGGTGTASKELNQPKEFPEGYEAGTVNAPGIIGLGEALRFIDRIGTERIRKHEETLISNLQAGILNINEMKPSKKITVYGPLNAEKKTGILLFNMDGMNSEEVTELLDTKFDIASRGGFHCAGLAHETIGTYESGGVRLSVGPFNTEKEIEKTIYALYKIANTGK